MSDVQLDKKTYIGIVRFTLQSMVELAAENKEYNLLADTLYYYEKTIKPENILNKNYYSISLFFIPYLIYFIFCRFSFGQNI